MDVKYQVFVSSTFEDLKDERRAVIEAVLNLNHIPVGMEAFQASDDTQWDYIKRRIDESDYYVVIVAERYGSELRGKSYTQMEYEYAVAKGVPVAAFLLDSSVRKSWPSDKVEFDKKDKVEKFRTLCQKKLVKHWRNADDLGGKVSAALSGLVRERPRTGWVRADSVPSPRVLEELTVLSEEKRDLQRQLSAFSQSEILSIPADVLWRLRTLDSTTISELMDYSPMDPEMSILEHFQYAAAMLTDSCSLGEIKEQLESMGNASYEAEAAEGFLRELIANKIVETQKTVRSHIYGTETIYTLTDYGKEFLMYMKEWLFQKSAQSGSASS